MFASWVALVQLGWASVDLAVQNAASMQQLSNCIGTIMQPLGAWTVSWKDRLEALKDLLEMPEEPALPSLDMKMAINRLAMHLPKEPSNINLLRRVACRRLVCLASQRDAAIKCPEACKVEGSDVPLLVEFLLTAADDQIEEEQEKEDREEDEDEGEGEGEDEDEDEDETYIPGYAQYGVAFLPELQNHVILADKDYARLQILLNPRVIWKRYRGYFAPGLIIRWALSLLEHSRYEEPLWFLRLLSRIKRMALSDTEQRWFVRKSLSLVLNRAVHGGFWLRGGEVLMGACGAALQFVQREVPMLCRQALQEEWARMPVWIAPQGSDPNVRRMHLLILEMFVTPLSDLQRPRECRCTTPYHWLSATFIDALLKVVNFHHHWSAQEYHARALWIYEFLDCLYDHKLEVLVMIIWVTNSYRLMEILLSLPSPLRESFPSRAITESGQCSPLVLSVILDRLGELG